jgi:AsmA protein
MKHKALWIIVGIIVTLLLVILLLPFLIDANQFRPRIESSLSAALDRKVEIGNISLSILSGGVSVDAVSISDDPAFSREPFLRAKSLKVGVQLLPLILSKQLHVTAFTIDQPEVTLLRSSKGTWNYSTLGATKPDSKAANSPSRAGSAGRDSDSSSNMDLSVQRLTIEDGKLFVGDAGSQAKKSEYDELDLEASDLSYTSQFPFKLSVKTPGNGMVKFDGKAGPLNRADASETPIDSNLDVKNFNLASTGFVEPSSGLGGVLDFAGTLSSDGRHVSSKGTIHANKLQLVSGGSPARIPVDIQYDTQYDLKPQTGVLKQGDVRFGKALTRLTGTYNLSGETTTVQMKLNGENVPFQDFEALLPALGVTLPSGASLQGGTLSTNLTISGPVNRLVTTGPLNLSNAKVAGFSLGSKLGALAAFTGVSKGSDTTIQTLNSNLRVAPEGIRADHLNLIVAGLGNLTGDGTISADHALNFKMLAKLDNAAQSSLGAIANLAGLGQGQVQSGSGIPFLIQGTTSNPVFIPDMAGVVKGLTKNGAPGLPNGTQGQQDLGGLLNGLLNRKKKP